MSMLTINEKQMDVFEQLQFQKLKQQIAKVLSEKIDNGERFDPEKQRRLVEFLFNEAQKAKMIFDTEYILFALVCMSADEGCQSFLNKGEVNAIFADEALDNKEKLIKLSELTTIKIKKKEGSWEIKRREESV